MSEGEVGSREWLEKQMSGTPRKLRMLPNISAFVMSLLKFICISCSLSYRCLQNYFFDYFNNYNVLFDNYQNPESFSISKKGPSNYKAAVRVWSHANLSSTLDSTNFLSCVINASYFLLSNLNFPTCKIEIIQ